MPGHKGMEKNKDYYKYDITEIPGADNLHDPQGIILDVQKKCAKIYGSDDARLLINGSTTGIQSAILGGCNPGDSLLIPTNCHRSVFGALILGRINGIYLHPEIDLEMGFPKEVLPETVLAAITKNPEIVGMVLTNPTYYGTTSDVIEIAKILHKQGKFLIIDEAHGAHLHFNKNYPEDGISAGGDVVIQSTHKILGSLTQSSLIHFQGNRINQQRIINYLSILQSSSPSYPLMISLEEAVDQANDQGESIFEWIYQSHKAFYKNQNKTFSITLYDSENSNSGYDRSKWLFHTKGILGSDLEKILFKDYGIQCELSSKNHVLAMTGIGTTKEALQVLMTSIQTINEEIVESIDNKEKSSQQDRYKKSDNSMENFNSEMPLWTAFNWERKELDTLESAEDKIAGDFIIPYPPGVPLLIPGSRITKKIINRLNDLLDSGVVVVGMDENRELLIIKEKGASNGR